MITFLCSIEWYKNFWVLRNFIFCWPWARLGPFWAKLSSKKKGLKRILKLHYMVNSYQHKYFRLPSLPVFSSFLPVYKWDVADFLNNSSINIVEITGESKTDGKISLGRNKAFWPEHLPLCLSLIFSSISIDFFSLISLYQTNWKAKHCI